MSRILLPLSAVFTVVYVATGLLALIVAALLAYAVERWER
jgi:K+-transporting ATPase A subunit